MSAKTSGAKTGHTPGPWRVWPRNDRGARRGHIPVGPEHAGASSAPVEVNGLYSGDDGEGDAESNARLIAQAPAMYEALKRLVLARDIIAGGEVDALTVEAVRILAAIEGGQS